MAAKPENAPDLWKIMQIIFNFRFWKIRLFKKYHRTFFFKLQNGYIIQNGADHYNFHSWTTIFVFFNRFGNLYKLSILKFSLIFIFKMAEIFKMAFSDFLYFIQLHTGHFFKLKITYSEENYKIKFIFDTWKYIIALRNNCVCKKTDLVYATRKMQSIFCCFFSRFVWIFRVFKFYFRLKSQIISNKHFF
jgi:hypothetical protein